MPAYRKLLVAAGCSLCYNSIWNFVAERAAKFSSLLGGKKLSYSVNPSLWSRVFPIPVDITDKHIKMCSGVALKCLLLILRAPDEFNEAAALAQKLNQPVSEIADALNYWEEQGILCR